MPTQLRDVPIHVVGPDGRTYYVGGYHRSRVWGVTPNWKTTRMNKEPWQIPINGYTDGLWHIQSFDYAIERIDNHFYPPGVYSQAVYGWGPEFGNVSSDFTYFRNLSYTNLASRERLLNEALIKNLNKAADVKVNIPVTVAEAGKTGRMVVDAAKRIFSAYKSFRRRDFANVAKILNLKPGTVHKSWLEYTYGWTPLVYEVQGAAEAFAKTHCQRPITFQVRTKEVSGDSFYQKFFYGAFWRPGPAVAEISSESFRKVKVDVWYQVVNEQFSTANSLGLTNAASVAWELVPFSFVFDWFISVGNYLQALTALNGLTVLRSYSSCLDESSFARFGTQLPYQEGAYTYAGFTTQSVGTYRSYERSPLIVDPLAIYPPVDRDPLNWKHVLSGLSLIKAQHSRMR